MTSPALTLVTGLIIDERYTIERVLGRGGMGEVYAARRRAIGDEVALKRLLPLQDTANNRRRFAIEAQAAAHIRHPNVVRIFDYGEDASIGPYIVMELLEGPTLAALTYGTRLPLARALELFSGVCAAIEAGHRRGILHRDLKPANVIVSHTDDGRELVKVLDFGLAVDERLGDRNITTPGTIVGTIAYMAPEQTDGSAASPASDLFSLGVMLYELVTGKLPFAGVGTMETLLAISGGRYQPPRELVPDLPDGVVAAITAALERDPGARPASAERLAQLALGGVSAASSALPPARAAAAARPAPASPRPRRATLDTVDTSDLAPAFAYFVGRAAELAALDRALADTWSGNPPLAVITGDAGLGKSRLAQRVGAAARKKGALVLHGRFFDYVGSRPPPLETFLAMIDDRTHPARADSSWTSLDEVGAGQRYRAFAAIADALAGQAAGRPMVIVLDDLHWATRLDLELVDHVHRTLAARGTLIVGTARADGSKDFAAWRASRAGAILEVPLAGLDEAEVRAWLEGGFRGIRVSPIDARRLWKVSGGNPFALVEIGRQLLARGVLARDGAGWRMAALGEVELPASVSAMATARVDELAPQHRSVLELGAVLGDEFRVATLVAAAGVGEAAVDDAVDAGLALRLLSERDVSVGNDCRFTSPVMRQAIYDRMPARARRRAHRAVVDALTAIYGDADDRFAHVFSYHYHAVGAWPEAFAFSTRAAAEALARGDYELGRAAVARADDAADELAALGQHRDDALAARLDRVAGTIATALGDAAAGAARLERAAATAPTPALAIDAHVELARNLGARGELVAAVAVAERAAATAAEVGDTTRNLIARTTAADIGGRAGLVTAAVLDRLVDECRTAAPELRARALMVRAWRRMKAGRFSDAEHDGAEARDLARAGGLLEIELRVVASQAAMRSEAGDLAGSHALAEQVLAMARRLGDRRREAIALANLGEGRAEDGDAARGHELLREALQIFIDIGDRACEGDCRVNLGRALLALGRIPDAIAMLTEGSAMCARASRLEYEGIARMLLGEAHRAARDLPASAADFTRAVELLGKIELNSRWRAELGLARTLAELGERDRARDHATRARDLLTAQRARLAAGTAPTKLDAALADAAAVLATLAD